MQVAYEIRACVSGGWISSQPQHLVATFYGPGRGCYSRDPRRTNSADTAKSAIHLVGDLLVQGMGARGAAQLTLPVG